MPFDMKILANLSLKSDAQNEICDSVNKKKEEEKISWGKSETSYPKIAHVLVSGTHCHIRQRWGNAVKADHKVDVL